jgi:rare lipoprotein A (peptidoglycan hydrolase)
MKPIRTVSALVLSVGMAAASDPGTVKTHNAVSQPANSMTKVSVSTENTQKPANSGKPTRKKPQIGTASWYGENFQGRTTASGETYDMYQFTAAHRELPMGSWLKVTNMRSGKWVIVKINDRGPFVGDRILDLSDSAADVLEIKGRGLAKVKLELVDEPATMASANSVGLE